MKKAVKVTWFISCSTLLPFLLRSMPGHSWALWPRARPTIRLLWVFLLVWTSQKNFDLTSPLPCPRGGARSFCSSSPFLVFIRLPHFSWEPFPIFSPHWLLHPIRLCNHNIYYAIYWCGVMCTQVFVSCTQASAIPSKTGYLFQIFSIVWTWKLNQI